MTPALFSVPLIDREWLSENTILLSLPRPDGFEYLPGQRIRVYHESLERDYSLASGPADPELKLVIRIFSRGRVSTFLSSVEIGTPISFYGPMGYFVFQASDRTPVFVATGTGIAPFVAMCRSGVSGFICLHGARREAGLFFAAELKRQAARYVPCLTSDSSSAGECFGGRVTDYLRRMPAAQPYDFYLCGRQAMVHDAIEVIDARFAGSRVHSEVFY